MCRRYRLFLFISVGQVGDSQQEKKPYKYKNNHIKTCFCNDNIEKIDNLIKNLGNAEYILINTCDLLPCPHSDGSCSQKHNDFINLLKNRFNLEHYSEYGSCEYYIFR